MSTLLTRAPRALMFAVATLFTLSLLAPLAVFASTDLVSGDQAVITNPNGSGANLRNDNTVLDESTLVTELPQGAIVTIVDGPYATETGVWFWVAAEYPLEGWVEASLLTKADSQPEADLAAAAPELPAETSVPTEVAGLAWLEPIDSAVVVDDNLQLPVEGLAVRVSASVDGEIIGRVPVGSTLDVTEQRIWEGEQSFVRVNFNGQGGYVNGTYIVLASEQVVEEPVTDEVPVEEAPVVTEVPTEEPIVTEVPTEEVPVVTEVPTEEVPVVTEVPTETAPVVTEVPTEEPIVTEVPTEELPVATEEPVVTEEPVTTEAQTEAAPLVEDVATEEVPVATAEPTVESVPTEEPAVTAEAPVAEDAVETEVVTDEPAATPEAPVADDVPTEEVPVVDEATEVAVEIEEATAIPTEEPTQEATEAPAPAVTSAPAFDAESMIGSATVTGTNDGLRCRVAPDATAATLMVLSEGTKVLVFAEAQNGYLGIDCGGVQGYADVNYLWSGGAGDEEIKNSNMSVVVSGTGNGLNCRTGAGLSYPVITVLRDGTSMTTRGAASNGWVPVVCGGQNGFVSTTWVEVKAGPGPTGNSGGGSSTTTGTAKVVNTNGDGLYCRTGAGTTYSAITVLSPSQTVTVRGANQGAWTPVICGGTNGFAHSQYLSISAGTTTPSNPAPSKPAPSEPAPSTGTVTVANTGGVGLNCRSGASTSFGVITVLSLGQTVSTRSGSTSGWTAVVCGGTNGFVSSEFVTGGGSAPAPSNPSPAPTPAPKPSGMSNGDHAQTTAALNLRYKASLGSGVATVAPNGTVVLITGAATSGFYPVDYDGIAGFMSADYLVKTNSDLTQRGGSANPTTPSEPAPAPGGGSATGSAMVSYAMNYVGYPYVWATAGPSSFDCSGFTYWVVKNVMGRDIGRGTWTQVATGTPVGRNDLQPGDLVFHQNTYTTGLSHVGLYIGDNKMVNALNENAGVVVTDITSDYWESRWYGARRL